MRLRDRRKPPCILGPRARAVAGVKVAVLEGDLAIRQQNDVGFEAVRDM